MRNFTVLKVAWLLQLFFLVKPGGAKEVRIEKWNVPDWNVEKLYIWTEF